MNVIFGIILVALLILAVRVIWATGLQLIAVMKAGIALFKQQWTIRSLPTLTPISRPYLPPRHDWEFIADTVRQEIRQRNIEVNRDLERLDTQLQAKLKTIELVKVDIQIAKLEQELFKIKPAPALQTATGRKKSTRSKLQPVTDGDTLSRSTPPQVQQLRAALTCTSTATDEVTGNVRH